LVLRRGISDGLRGTWEQVTDHGDENSVDI
jgi:hypothetical protein